MTPRLRPIEHIELKDGASNKKHLLIAGLLLAIGLGFIGYAISVALSSDPGWVQIDPVAESSESVAGDLVFFYELGASGHKPNAEHKALAPFYTEVCMDAFRIFTVDYPYEDVHNLYYLHEHIGEAVTVDPALYRAFEAIDKAGSRFLFAAPFYREYRNLFSDTEDGSAIRVDPFKNSEIAAYFAELSVFTSSQDHIRLTLHGDNTVTLTVSDEYRAFARENGIETFVDFYWARNAFALDYVADRLIEKGYVYGSISSYDGFVRALDTRDVPYTYNLFDLRTDTSTGKDTVYNAARLHYSGETAIVFLRSYPMMDQDDMYYIYKTGERRHPYVDVTDGLCKNALDGLVSYASKGSCADVLLSMMPLFVADTWNADAVGNLSAQGIHSIYITDETVYHTDSDAEIDQFYCDESVTYSSQIAP